MRTEAADAVTSEPLASSEEVAAAASVARAHGRIGIDTEFMSEGRYRALLCLVQIAVDEDDSDGGGPRISLIDPLEGEVDVTPMAQLLADPAIEVVLHAGRQDVAILRRAWGTEITNIFDTQLAAGFVGASAQTGYGNLLGTMLGRRVGKTASYTRWDARPLTAEQLSYAAEDVAHLLELADEVQRRLRGDRTARLGPRGVPAPGVRQRRARSRTPPGSGCRASGSSTRAPARWRASWRPGASAPRPRRTGRSARCSATRRWSSSPSATRRTSARSSRSAGSTRRGSAAAARRSSRRSPPA